MGKKPCGTKNVQIAVTFFIFSCPWCIKDFSGSKPDAENDTRMHLQGHMDGNKAQMFTRHTVPHLLTLSLSVLTRSSRAPLAESISRLHIRIPHEEIFHSITNIPNLK